MSKSAIVFSLFFPGDMNICRWGADVGSLGPFLYICGGSDDSSRLETVERFDPFANVWVPSVPMSSSRNGVGVTAGSGRIYALGKSCRVAVLCLARKAREHRHGISSFLVEEQSYL